MEKNLEEDGDGEGREGEDDESRDQHMKDVSEDRMRAKKNPNGNIKTGMGSWRKGERNSRGTGARTKPSAV